MTSEPVENRAAINPFTGEYTDAAAEHVYRLSSYETLIRQTLQIGSLCVVALIALHVMDYLYVQETHQMAWISVVRVVGVIMAGALVMAARRRWPYPVIDRLFFAFALVTICDSAVMIYVFSDETVMMAARLPLYAMIANIMFSPAAIYRVIMNAIAWPGFIASFWLFTSDPMAAAPAITVVLSVAFAFGTVAGTWLIRLRRIEHFRASEQASTNRDLTVYKHELEQAMLAKSMFLSNVSHELRTPLNAIIGFSDMLKMQMYGPIGSPKYREYIQDIQDSGNHLLDLINDVLDLSRLEAGKAAMSHEWLDVAATAEACRKVVLAAHRNIDPDRIRLAIDPGLQVFIDARALQQILVNLLTNAVKYAGADARIIVRSEIEDDGGLCLEVSDDGVGMDQATILRLMKPFEQADAITARQSDGWGLGLPLANSLAAANGSELSIESRPGEGTRVRLSIPRGQVRVLPDQSEPELARTA